MASHSRAMLGVGALLVLFTMTLMVLVAPFSEEEATEIPKRHGQQHPEGYQCGARSDAEHRAYVIVLRSEFDLEGSDDLDYSARTDSDLYVGIGDQIHDHWAHYGCAARHGLQVVCHPEAFQTTFKHHTGNMGFLWGCHSKYFACGLFTAWADVDMALSIPEEVTVHQALEFISAMQGNKSMRTPWPNSLPAQTALQPVVIPVAPRKPDNLELSVHDPSKRATKRHMLTKRGKLVFRAATCQWKNKKERDMLYLDGIAFVSHQYMLMFRMMGRSTPLWQYPANERWRISVTVRRGDFSYGSVQEQCKMISKLYLHSNQAVNENNSQILVFSETSPEDAEFECLRVMPNARLFLNEKTLTVHDAQLRAITELDHHSNAHWFLGVHSYFSFIVEGNLDKDAMSTVMGLNKTRFKEILQRHPVPFLEADIRYREFNASATSVRHSPDRVIPNCCANHLHDDDTNP